MTRSLEQDARADRDPGRDEPPRVYRPVLVIGCPRSGTRYMQMCLDHAGVAVKHEAMGSGGSVSCLFAVDDYWYHGRHPDNRRSKFEFGAVLHQVREPLAAIGSMAKWLGGAKLWFWHWQEKHTGLSLDRYPHPELAARFWLDWNLRCEAQAEWTYRLEEVPRVWPEIARRCGVPGAPFPELVPRLGELAREEQVHWEDLPPALAAEIALHAKRWGYYA